jgi:ABC-type antimicrobial peptide transport system permease subunit
MALGASRSDVLRLVLRQGFTMAAIGVAVGLVGALLTTRVLRTLVFGVSTTDPAVFLVIVMVLCGTAWLASYVPARRATRVDPLVTLRYE